MAPVSPSSERLVAEWTEPPVALPLSKGRFGLAIAASLALAALLGAFAWWQHDASYYFAAVAALVGGGAITLQKSRPAAPLAISLTDARVAVGRKEYPLDGLAGFWLAPEAASTVINLEPARATMFPIAIHYPGTPEEAYELLSAVLPEVEPRESGISDALNRIIRPKP